MRTPRPGQMDPIRPQGIQPLVDWRYVDGGSVKWSSHGAKLGLWDVPGADMVGNPKAPQGIRIEAQKARLEKLPFDQDQPWEQGYMMYVSTVIRDQGTYKMWYAMVPPDHYEDNDLPWKIGTGLILCYAESADGTSWKKPALGLASYHEHTETNIVFGRSLSTNGFSSGSVFVDPSAPAEERYKLIYKGDSKLTDELRENITQRWGDDLDPQSFRGGGLSVISGATSADGIHWTQIEEPLLVHHSDQLNNASWDEESQRYVGYFRSWRYNRRCVARAETTDFRHWPKTPDPILETPLDWNPAVDVYTSPATTYPGSNVKIMFPDVYDRFTDSRSAFLASSEDGASWHWVPGGAVVERTPPGDWAGGDLIVGHGMVELPDGRVGVPVVGFTVPHKHPRHLGEPLGSPGWATWEPGRLSALVADGRGEFTTLPIVADGNSLELNVLTEIGGGISIEIQTAKGEPVDGFTFSDADTISGDVIGRKVSWRGSTDLSSIAGTPIRFSVRMWSAHLFAFEFIN